MSYHQPSPSSNDTNVTGRVPDESRQVYSMEDVLEALKDVDPNEELEAYDDPEAHSKTYRIGHLTIKVVPELCCSSCQPVHKVERMSPPPTPPISTHNIDPNASLKSTGPANSKKCSEILPSVAVILSRRKRKRKRKLDKHGEAKKAKEEELRGSMDEEYQNVDKGRNQVETKKEVNNLDEIRVESCKQVLEKKKRKVKTENDAPSTDAAYEKCISTKAYPHPLKLDSVLDPTKYSNKPHEETNSDQTAKTKSKVSDETLKPLLSRNQTSAIELRSNARSEDDCFSGSQTKALSVKSNCSNKSSAHVKQTTIKPPELSPADDLENISSDDDSDKPNVGKFEIITLSDDDDYPRYSLPPLGTTKQNESKSEESTGNPITSSSTSFQTWGTESDSEVEFIEEVAAKPK